MQTLKHLYGRKAIDGVPGESRNRFDKYEIYEPFLAVGNHPVEIVPVQHRGPGDTFVSINIDKRFFFI